MYTTSVPTAGDDSPIRLPVGYFQRRAPVARSSASRSPSPLPMYTTPFAMAADDSMTSPAAYVQSSLSVAGNVAADTPVSRGLPRNWRHSSAAAAPVVTAALAEAAGAGCCAPRV